MNRKIIKIFTICFFMELLVCIESSSMLPLMTYLADFFNIKASFIQYVNIGFFVVGLTVPAVGMLADRTGNKKILCYATLLSAIGILITSISKNAVMYGVGRTFSGFAYVLMNSVLLAYISSFTTYENRGKATGVIKVAFGCGMMLGPLLATYFVNKYSLFTYYFTLAMIVFCAFLMSLSLPENKVVKTDKGANTSNKLVVFKNKSAVKLLTSFQLFLIALYLELNFLSVWLASRFSLDISEIGVVFTINAMGTISGILLCVYLADKIGKHRFAFIAMAIMICSLVFLQIPIFNSKLIAVTIITFIFMAGVDGAITSIQAMCSELFVEQRAFFMTLTGVAMSISGLLTSLLGPIIYENGGYMINLFIGTIMLAISILIFYGIKKDKALMSKLGE